MDASGIEYHEHQLNSLAGRSAIIERAAGCLFHLPRRHGTQALEDATLIVKKAAFTANAVESTVTTVT